MRLLRKMQEPERSSFFVNAVPKMTKPIDTRILSVLYYVPSEELINTISTS